MSLTAGYDLGSLFTKIVLLRDSELLASNTVPTTGTIAAQLPELMHELLREAGLQPEALDSLASTGWGRELVDEVDFDEETMTCVGTAVRRLQPEVSLILDVGGQSITALALDAEGEVRDFMRNDKCASGTGRFLEVMSQALAIPIAALDRTAARATAPAGISSQCGVFVESEVITHLNAGVGPAEISAGLCDAVARIVVAQLRRFTGGRATDFTLTGGVARIQNVVDRVCHRVDGIYRPYPGDPQLAAAVGAALLAGECGEGQAIE